MSRKGFGITNLMQQLRPSTHVCTHLYSVSNFTQTRNQQGTEYFIYTYLFIIDPTCVGLNGNHQGSLNTVRSKTITFPI